MRKGLFHNRPKPKDLKDAKAMDEMYDDIDDNDDDEKGRSHPKCGKRLSHGMAPMLTIIIGTPHKT